VIRVRFLPLRLVLPLEDHRPFQPSFFLFYRSFERKLRPPLFSNQETKAVRALDPHYAASPPTIPLSRVFLFLLAMPAITAEALFGFIDFFPGPAISASFSSLSALSSLDRGGFPQLAAVDFVRAFSIRCYTSICP